MSPKRVLAVDDDPWILELISSTLRKIGMEVVCCAHPREALSFALSEAPHVVICEWQIASISADRLIKRLRSFDSMQNVPAVLLCKTEPTQEVLAVTGKHTLLLRKPFRFEALLDAVRSLLPERPSRRPPPPPRKSSEVAGEGSMLRGRLEQLSFPSLLTVLEMEGKTGVLALSHEREGLTSTKAQISLREGRVVQARIENGLGGAEGVYEVMGWKSGAFFFDDKEVEDEDEVGQSTMTLLMEGARRIDESKR